MDLKDGKSRFIESWGKLGSYWGINRTMAQIHALLLISPAPLSAETIMEELKISRGNANMNLRALLDWGLAFKVLKSGHRKEFFEAEKDMWRIFRQVVQQRRKKELDPMLEVLGDISKVEAGCPDSTEFCKVVTDLKDFSRKAENILHLLERSDNNAILGSLLKLVK